MSQPDSAAESRTSSQAAVRRKPGVVRQIVGLVIWLPLLAVLGLIVWGKLTPEGQQTVVAWCPAAKPWFSDPAPMATSSRVDAEQRAAEALRELGVLVIAEPPDRQVTSVNFRGRPFDETVAQLVADLFRLQSINLADSELADEQLQHLSELSELSSLVLAGTALSDEGLAHLRGLKHLESLLIPDTKITNGGLRHVAAIGSVAILDLSDTAVDDQGLKHLLPLGRLHHLLLVGNDITDAGIKTLEGMPDLRRLTLLGNTKVTQEALRALIRAHPGLAVDSGPIVTSSSEAGEEEDIDSNTRSSRDENR